MHWKFPVCGCGLLRCGLESKAVYMLSHACLSIQQRHGVCRKLPPKRILSPLLFEGSGRKAESGVIRENIICAMNQVGKNLLFTHCCTIELKGSACRRRNI